IRDFHVTGVQTCALPIFSVAYWHTFASDGRDIFGGGTLHQGRAWEKGKDPVSVALTRLDAGFEFFQKVRSPFWCFHDRDIAPERSEERRVGKEWGAQRAG